MPGLVRVGPQIRCETVSFVLFFSRKRKIVVLGNTEAEAMRWSCLWHV